MENLLFYDIEVFKYDSLVVFKNINNEEVAHFWNEHHEDSDHIMDEPNGFQGVYNVIKNKVLAGYNNYYYDDVILSKMLLGLPQRDIKQASDELIAGTGLMTKPLSFIKSIDMIQQIDIARPSLKQIEGNMGKSIVESKIDFTIDRPLTDEEKEEVLKYCSYDVENTIEIYKLRKSSYFDTKNELLKMLDGKSDMSRYNTTTIVAKILMPDGCIPWTGLRISDRREDIIPPQVWNMWDSWREEDLYIKDKTKLTGVDIQLLDCDFTFGFGGLHGVNHFRKEFKNVKLLDVGSMYPSIINLLNGLSNSTQLYDDIRKERLRIKHTDPVRAGALKLILNSTYGLMKNKYSTLYNPYASTTICVFGQIALFDLCKRLYDAGYQLINANTDGIAFNTGIRSVRKPYTIIWKEWESDYGLTLELDEFDRWIQKDVNNYVATQGDHIKVKGGEVNKYHKDKLFANNNIRICQIALVNKLLFDISPLQTINEYLTEENFKPSYFMYILKAGHTFKGVYDADEFGKPKTKYQNVNRVFAWRGNYSDECVKLYKLRRDDGLVNFPDTPEHMKLWNGDVNDIDFKDFKKKIDKNFYIKIIEKKLEGWT